MADTFKQSIRERAGLQATGNLYRGGDFDFPTIYADEVDVWYVEEDAEEVDDARPRSAEEALTVRRKETKQIAGGLSSRVAGSEKFARSLSEVGVILVFDPETIKPQPEPIEYNLPWMDDHPGLLARIDTLSNGEIRSADDGRVLGLTWEEGGIHKGKRENLEFTATSSTYSEEKEWFAYSPTLAVGDALIGGLSVVHQQKAVGGSVQGALNEYDDYSIGGLGRGTEDVTRMSPGEQATALWEKVRSESAIIRDNNVPYWVVVVEDDREWKSNGGIEPSEFVVASDGTTTITEPSKLPAYIPL